MINEDTSRKVEKKDLNKVFWRQFGLQVGWNYEKMMGMGYCFTMIPIIEKFYKDKEEKKEALDLHLQFFNTNPTMAPYIIGADIAIEEEAGLENKEAINSFKVGLMGPFAGIGDTVFVAIYRSIVFSIAAYLALEGNFFGAIFPVITALLLWGVRYKFLMVGYNQGHKLITGFANQLQILNEAAMVLGLTVIGGLIPSILNVKTPLVFTHGEVKMELQPMIDKILPSLIPVSLVLFCYWLLGKKHMNSTKLIVILMIMGIALGALNILK